VRPGCRSRPPPATPTAQLNAAATQQPAPAASATSASASQPTAAPARTAVQACRRYTGHAWQELGYATLADCLQLAFRDNCNMTSAQFGQAPLRRFNGLIQAQLQTGRWVEVARATCLAQPQQTQPSRPGLLHRIWPWSSSTPPSSSPTGETEHH
jgi:hypothetical protein